MKFGPGAVPSVELGETREVVVLDVAFRTVFEAAQILEIRNIQIPREQRTWKGTRYLYMLARLARGF
jgi:hypothetical protein